MAASFTATKMLMLRRVSAVTATAIAATLPRE
jgi:hypothetical protein